MQPLNTRTGQPAQILCFAEAFEPATQLRERVHAGLAAGECWEVLADPRQGAAVAGLAELEGPRLVLHQGRSAMGVLSLLAQRAWARAELSLTHARWRELSAALERSSVPQRIHALEASSVFVDRDEDPRQCAMRIAEQACAQRGQSTATLRRVYCQDRRMGELTQALLPALALAREGVQALELWDHQQSNFLEQARSLGLDEGASPILCEPDLLCFTHVQRNMRLAALSRPAPLLCLLRVPSREAAMEIESSLVARAQAEDLGL